MPAPLVAGVSHLGPILAIKCLEKYRLCGRCFQVASMARTDFYTCVGNGAHGVRKGSGLCAGALFSW
jgi:hypothetical protein